MAERLAYLFVLLLFLTANRTCTGPPGQSGAEITAFCPAGGAGTAGSAPQTDGTARLADYAGVSKPAGYPFRKDGASDSAGIFSGKDGASQPGGYPFRKDGASDSAGIFSGEDDLSKPVGDTFRIDAGAGSVVWVSQTETETETEVSGLLSLMEGYLDISEIEETLSGLTAEESFSFSDALQSFLKGEIPLNRDSLLETFSELFFGELKKQRNLAVQILAIVLASAVFANFVRIFENNQIADISFYMMYLMIAALLMNSFSGMTELVSETCESMTGFMKILLPSYLVTIVLSAGTVTAIGFYEITVLGVNLLQLLLIHLALPAIRLYLLVLLLNQLSGEDWFSRLAQLLELAIGWMIKTILGLVLGLQAVQCLIAPSVDALKTSALQRLAKAIPGIGNVLDAAAETVAASAVVIKNAVGAAGILALTAICFVPLIRLAVCILLFRVLCAAIQPISDKRMVESIEGISKGSALLLRVLVAVLAIFIISLAMITAAVRG